MGGAFATGHGLRLTSHRAKCFKIFLITSGSLNHRNYAHLSRTLRAYERIDFANGYYTDIITMAVHKLLMLNPEIQFKIQVSIDGLKNTHNQIRGNSNSFDNALETLRQLSNMVSKNLEIVACSTATKMNLSEIMPLMRLFIENFEIPYKFQFVRDSVLDSFNLDKRFVSYSFVI